MASAPPSPPTSVELDEGQAFFDLDFEDEDAGTSPVVTVTPKTKPARPEPGDRYTPEQRQFLDSHGAKRFANKTQAEAVLELAKSPHFEEGIKWTATNGMSLGKAISSLKTALPNWGKPKGGTSGARGNSSKASGRGGATPQWDPDEYQREYEERQRKLRSGEL